MPCKEKFRFPQKLCSTLVASTGCLLLLAGCTSTPDHQRLALWTQALAESQVDGPELLLFRRGSQQLAFVGVQHDSDPRSPTHRLIEATFDVMSPRVVIAEGVPTAWGYNPARIMELAREAPDEQGLLPNAETVPIVRGALRVGSKVIGGEPSDQEVRRITASLGIGARDLLGFYVLRVVPQWSTKRAFDDLRSEAATLLIDQQLARSRKELGLTPDILPDAQAWREWRLRLNAGADPRQIVIQEAGPLADGPWATSRVGAAISRARDSHLFELTKTHLAQHGAVLVVYGGSHALIQLPALERLLGRPCYRGTDVGAARIACKMSGRG